MEKMKIYIECASPKTAASSVRRRSQRTWSMEVSHLFKVV